MESITIIGIIINIMLMIISFILKPYFIYILVLICLTGLFITIRKKEIVKFIITCCVLFILSLYLILYLENDILFFIFLIILIISIMCGYYHIFDKQHNKANIRLNMIKEPFNKDYLVIKFIGGLDCKTGNGIIIKENSGYKILIENERIEEFSIPLQDIIKIEVLDKPYIYQEKVLKNSELDITRTYMTSVPISNPDSVIYGNKVKLKKSFLIHIFIKDNRKIALLSFNSPKDFLNIST